MKFNFYMKSDDVALLLLTIITVNGVASHPQVNPRNSDAIVGNIEIGRGILKGEIELPEQQTGTSSSIISGSVEVGEDYIKGHIDLPNKDVNHQFKGVDQDDNKKSNENFISGSVEINEKIIKGHIDIPDSDDSSHQAAGGTSGDGNRTEGKVITGSMNIGKTYVEGQIHLPTDYEEQKNTEDNKYMMTNNKGKGGVISGSVEINNDQIQGHVNIPSDSGSDNGMQNDNIPQRDDIIDGSIEINDKNIEGYVVIPSHGDNQDRGDNNQQEGENLKGTVEMDDENIERHLDVPGDSESQDNVHGDNNYSQQNDVTINGSIIIDDNNIEGHVDIPGDSESQDYVHGDNNQQNDGTINGSIVIDDNNIEGHINVPDNADSQDDVHGNNNQQDDDTINGSIAIDGENIEGHINVPDDGDSQDDVHGNNNQQDNDTINGSIAIDGENIEGHVNIPGDGDSQGGVHGDNNQQDDDTINGSIAIDGENIEGHVDIPGDGDSQGGVHGDNNQQDDDTINGSIAIDGENIEGHVDIPGSSNIETENDIPSDHESQNVSGTANDMSEKESNVIRPTIGKNCWMNLKSKPFLDALDKLDATYSLARLNYQENVGVEFDKKLLEGLLNSRGAAPRAIHEAQGNPCQIPAGINLGGYCMMRMTGSVLFFHRMKLRNSTQFRVDYLHTNLMDMTLTAHLSLNDLHLRGAYERSKTGRDPTEIYYVPTFGELDILLKDVNYKMEGRLRLLNSRLLVELVNSDLITNQILLTYGNDSMSMRLQPRNLEDYLQRLNADLDSWMKDYFNDYLMYYGIVGSGNDAEIQMYEKQRTVKANEYADFIIKAIKERLESLGAATVQLPFFKINSVNNAKIKLKSGLLRGLDSIYRRSVATTKIEKRIRQIDCIISFSKLKVEYQYEAMVYPHTPPVTGMLMLSADELTAHMAVTQLVGSETFDLEFDAVTQIKPESLTVEGPANRMIADYKHILERPIIAIMLNVMKHNIKMLKSLTRCEPYLRGSNQNRIRRDDGVKQLNEILADNKENRIDREPGYESEQLVPVDSLIPDGEDVNKQLLHILKER